MPIDPSIPLGINPGAVAGANVGTMQQNAYNANALAQQYKAMQTQNALEQILRQPGATDDDGQVTPDAMKRIMSVSPQAGMMVAQNQFKMRQQKMHLDMLSSDRFQQQMEMANKVKTDAHIAYNEAIRGGKNPQQAQEVAQEVYSNGVDTMKNSGMFGQEWLNKVNPKYDNNSAPGDEQAWMKYQMAVEAANERKRREKHQDFQENLAIGKETDRQATERAKLDLEERKFKAANPDFSAQPGQQAQSDVHGEEFLKTLKPEIAAEVKALDEGRMAFPSMGRGSARMQKLIEAVSQYDPDFDAVNYNARAKTRNSFTSGPDAKNITSINTSIGHMGSLLEAADALDNSSFRTYNTVKNWVSSNTGNPKVVKFETARQAVSDELTRVFRGTGGSLTEIQEWQKHFDSSNSPEQLHEAIKEAVDLLRSRIDAVDTQYKRGMGRSADVMELLTPKARETLDKLEGNPVEASSTSYKDEHAVKQAFQEGKISKEEALKILRSQFGYD